jgi:hypothetical protein
MFNKNMQDWVYAIYKKLVLDNGGTGSSGSSQVQNVIKDVTGTHTIAPDSCAEYLTYDENDNLIMDRYIDPIQGLIFTQTLIYENGLLTYVSGWACTPLEE